MVALSSLSVNTERDPPEAQGAIANLKREYPQIRTACQRADVGIGPYGCVQIWRCWPLKYGKKYSILDKLSYRPSVCDKAALVGESAVPCNLQSATAGMNSHPRSGLYRLPHISGDEESVSRNGIPRTMSGGEPSSIKRTFSCAVSLPLPSWLYG